MKTAKNEVDATKLMQGKDIMAIQSVPAPPTPSFDFDDFSPDKNATSSTRNALEVRKSQIAPFGIEFFGRVEKSSLWFGSVIALFVWSATQSKHETLSFCIGGLVSLLMLRSQVWFVTSLVRPKTDGRRSAPKMLWALQPLKYAVLMVFFGWALRAQALHPAFFALGVSLSPFVILAKAIGRIFAFNARPLAEVYGTPASSTRSLKK